jgi:ribosomal protein L7Ae-like RNA K-turn-binding protein
MVNNIKVGKLLHTNAKAPASLVETVGNLLAQKGLNSLGLARKSGCLTIGFDKTKEAIDKGVVDFVIEATDSSPATQAKLLGKAQDILCFSLYSSAELSSALGFENMMYAAVKKSPISSMVKQNLTRYQTFLNE